jgi:hypothetical protein
MGIEPREQFLPGIRQGKNPSPGPSGHPLPKGEGKPRESILLIPKLRGNFGGEGVA